MVQVHHDTNRSVCSRDIGSTFWYVDDMGAGMDCVSLFLRNDIRRFTHGKIDMHLVSGSETLPMRLDILRKHDILTKALSDAVNLAYVINRHNHYLVLFVELNLTMLRVVHGMKGSLGPDGSPLKHERQSDTVTRNQFGDKRTNSRIHVCLLWQTELEKGEQLSKETLYISPSRHTVHRRGVVVKKRKCCYLRPLVQYT
jgi:hypothetical protein